MANADDALAKRVVVVHPQRDLGHGVAVREGKVHDAGGGTACPEAGVLPDAFVAAAPRTPTADRSGCGAGAARPVVDAVDGPPVREE